MSWAEQWQEAIAASFGAFANEISRFLPNLLGFVVILTIGYAISKLLQRIAVLALKKVRLDRATERSGIHEWISQARLKTTPSELIGRCVFWLFMLVFFVSATDTLGLENVSRTIQSFVAYIPNIIAALAILIVGLLVARFVRNLIRQTLTGFGVDQSTALARLAYGFLVAVVCIAAVGQLKIETTLIGRVVEIALLAIGAGIALTLAFATRDVAGNIIGGIYARDVFEPGMRISVTSVAEGSVDEVGTVNTRIMTDAGETVWIPNAQLINKVVTAPVAERA